MYRYSQLSKYNVNLHDRAGIFASIYIYIYIYICIYIKLNYIQVILHLCGMVTTYMVNAVV